MLRRRSTRPSKRSTLRWAARLGAFALAWATTLTGVAPASAAGILTEASWEVFNSLPVPGPAPTIVGIQQSNTVTGSGELVGFSLVPGDFVLPGGGMRGPSPELTAFAEVNGRRLRAYAEVDLPSNACAQGGVPDAGCGFSSGNNVAWNTNHRASARAAIVDDLLISAGAAFDGLSGLLQIPVTTSGRLYAEIFGAAGNGAGYQTSLTGGTINGLIGSPTEEFITGRPGVLNVRFTFGQTESYSLSLQAFANGPGTINAPSDGGNTISDFSSTVVIGVVDQLRVDADSNGSFETTLTQSFSIGSALGIDYLTIPEPGISLLLLAGLLAVSRGVARGNQ